MKKKFIFILFLVLSIVLIGCKENGAPPEEKELTAFEKVQEAKEKLEIGDINNVLSNIALPKIGEHEVIITWKSSNHDVLTNAGVVTRPADNDVVVNLTANLSIAATVDTKIFKVTVKAIPKDIIGKLNEIRDNFVLYPKDSIDLDTIILPRVADQYLVYMDYETSNPNIIDLDGKVTQTNSEQTVDIKVKFILEGESVEKTYTLKVSPKPQASPIISLEDSRIIRRVAVKNNIELIAAINDAKPGDAIILENGRYPNINLSVSTSGTKENPIFIIARNPGKATIEGESSITVRANHVIIANLLITNGNPSIDKGAVIFEGDYLRFTNCIIDNFQLEGNDYKWISLTGNYHEIDRNIFTNKITGGSLLTIWRNDNSPDFHHIHLNQFKNYKNGGGLNGYETIRVGTSQNSQSDSYVVIEDNLFEEVNGEIEIISIKAGRTIIQGNTFKKCVGMITSRHGKNNLIEDNVVLANNVNDTGGIRAYDGGHIIRNNYIEKVITTSNTRGPIVIHSGNSVPGDTTVLNSQWTPFNLLIENNTIIDSTQSILFCGKYAYPAKDIVIKNNYIEAKTGEAPLRFDKTPDTSTFINNKVFAVKLTDHRGNLQLDSLEGVIFSTTYPNISPNEQGLILASGFGAKDLIVYNESTTGTTWK
ncbi:MAG: polysaccharide lyase 6 family protein [Bacilli bacterium]|nr:polysaccharide lyase 6 family protein [Bacilli bacterium]